MFRIVFVASVLFSHAFAALSLGAVKVPPGFVYEPILKGELKEPLDLKFDPNGLLWITCRRGQIFVYDPAKKKGELIAELDVDTSGERGLHGIEFHPKFQQNGLIFLYYAKQIKKDLFNLVTEWKVTKGEDGFPVLGEKPERELLKSISAVTSFHEGGALLYHPGDKKEGEEFGKLYVTVGDNLQSPKTPEFYLDKKMSPQAFDDLRGKVLRINIDGSIPKENPFFNQKGKNGEIYTMGHRNPYSITLDKRTGTVYVGEVGWDEGYSSEEINKLQPGGNYGWPMCQGKNRDTLNKGPCSLEGAIDPFLSYARGKTASITVGPVATAADTALVSTLGAEKGIFFGDMAGKWIRFAPFGKDDAAPERSTLVATGLGAGALAFALHPSGQLCWVEYGGFFFSTPEDKVGCVSLDKKYATPKVGDGDRGAFSVLSWDEQGAAVTNVVKAKTTLCLTATGKWKLAPAEVLHGPDGVERKEKAPAGFVMPGAPVGALVVKRQLLGNVQAVGAKSTLELDAGETVRFSINDALPGMAGRVFDDNEGALSVTWETGACK